MVGNVQSLTRALFSLDEPWRCRFLDLVTNMAVSRSKRQQQPTKREVANWLNTNPSLYQDIRYMLNAWRRSWNVWLNTSLVQT